jgi:RimJ/RimL family protein N-acetyltransferase
MADEDLQIGDVWTDEAHRGKGLATFAMGRILAALKKPGRRFWYVVGDGNAASIRIPERAGFTLVGTGRKWPRLGLGVLGKYVPDEPATC